MTGLEPHAVFDLFRHTRRASGGAIACVNGAHTACSRPRAATFEAASSAASYMALITLGDVLRPTMPISIGDGSAGQRQTRGCIGARVRCESHRRLGVANLARNGGYAQITVARGPAHQKKNHPQNPPRV